MTELHILFSLIIWEEFEVVTTADAHMKPFIYSRSRINIEPKAITSKLNTYFVVWWVDGSWVKISAERKI